MTKFEVWKIVVNNNERNAVLFSVEKDLKSAYDLVCKLSEFVKDIKLVISDLDDGNVKMVIYNIEQVKK